MSKFQSLLSSLKSAIMSGWTTDQLLNETILVVISQTADAIGKKCPHSGVVLSRFSKSENREIPLNQMDIVHKLNVARIFIRDNDDKVCQNSEFLFQVLSFLAEDIAINITN